MYVVGYMVLKMSGEDYIIKVENLKKWFPVRKSFLASLFLKEKCS